MGNHCVKKYHVSALGINGLYLLSDEKDPPKSFIVIYVGLIIVNDLLWVNKKIQDRSSSNNSDAGFFCMSEKYIVRQSCEAQTVQLERNISREHSQNFPGIIFNQQPTASL